MFFEILIIVSVSIIAWFIFRIIFSYCFYELMPHLDQGPGHGNTIFILPIFYLLFTFALFMCIDLYPWLVFVHTGVVLTAYIRAAFKSYKAAHKVYLEDLEKSRQLNEKYGYSKGFEKGLKLGYENGYHAALKKYGIVPDEPITNPSDEEPDTVDDNYGGVFIEEDLVDPFTIENDEDPFTRRFG